MAFKRHVSDAFVRALNECYDHPGSWWRRVVDDPAAFIAIRNGYLNAYVAGGSLLRVGHSSRQGITCSIHEEYLIRRSPKAYVELTSDSTPKVEFVCGTDGLAKYYPDIKNRIKRFAHPERMGENIVAAQLPEIVDMEAAFSWAKGGARRGRTGRVDLVALAPSGQLVMSEAKLLSSPELRNGSRPSVLDQVKDYRNWVRQDRDDIICAYQHVLALSGKLRGRFFRNRLRQLSGTQITEVYDRPRLLIFGFDQRQKREELRPLIDSLCRGTADGHLSVADIAVVGDPRNLTARTLLRGI